MTTPEPPASLLRRAAERVELLACETSGDWWEVVENYPDAWVVRARYVQPPVPRRGVRNPPEPVTYLAAESSRGDMERADVHWMVLLGPQIAPALSAMLRALADDAEHVDAQNETAAARAARLGGRDGQTYLMQRSEVGHGVALARALLGEVDG